MMSDIHPSGEVLRAPLVRSDPHGDTVPDSFFHGHPLNELKAWLLGTKSGGSTINRRGNAVKDTFGEGELDILAGRG